MKTLHKLSDIPEYLFVRIQDENYMFFFNCTKYAYLYKDPYQTLTRMPSDTLCEVHGGLENVPTD